jgi:hypothetical protein
VALGDPGFPADFPADAVPFEDALVHAGWLRDAVCSSRPLLPADLLGTSSMDLHDVAARAAAAAQGYRAAAAQLGTHPDAALATLAGYGVTGLDAAAAAAETARVIARLDELHSATPGPQFADHPAVQTLRAIFGNAFPVLPVVDAPGEWTSALDHDPAFLGGDPAAPVAWVQQVGRVRAPVERFLLATGGGPLAVAQQPPAPHWAGLPLTDDEEPAPDVTSVLVHGAGAGATRLAGFVVDEWVDVIPVRRTTAGVAFDFDEPGARAPQAVLLAVPPVVGAPWTLDTLAAVLTETADLVRIRMVGPDELPWLGQYLPALYVADNSGDDTITVDLQELVTAVQP